MARYKCCKAVISKVTLVYAVNGTKHKTKCIFAGRICQHVVCVILNKMDGFQLWV